MSSFEGGGGGGGEETKIPTFHEYSSGSKLCKANK